MGTSGLQLEQALKNKGPFIIRTKNNLNKKDYKLGSVGIINLQDSTHGNGSHWVGYIIPPGTAKKNYYFDSYGAPPPEEVVKFLKKDKRPIVYSDIQLQKLDTDTCGEYVVDFIRTMNYRILGKSDKELQKKYLDFIYNIYTPTDLSRNEQMVSSRVKIR